MDTQAFQQYTENGFHIERGVFDREEVAQMVEHYMALNAQGAHPGDSAGVPAKSDPNAPDPWKKYPRMAGMEQWDERSKAWVHDARLKKIVGELIGQPPRLIQTMLYFKPPGGRGQSLHQDNLYLRTTPLMAAWVALDRADAENGAMEMLRGSHLLGLLPYTEADTDLSVTEIESVLPPYLERVRVDLDPGDAVFFGGLTIHGSPPNRSQDRFRRAFICHYAGELAYPMVGPKMPWEAAAQ